MDKRLSGHVKKGWGYELIWATNDKYCGKIMVFEKEGDTWHNPPLQPHQLEALEPMSSITEVSTPDSVEDNFRLIPGDSQSLDPENMIDG